MTIETVYWIGFSLVAFKMIFLILTGTSSGKYKQPDSITEWAVAGTVYTLGVLLAAALWFLILAADIIILAVSIYKWSGAKRRRKAAYERLLYVEKDND